MTGTRELVELLLAYDARTTTGRATRRAADLITAQAEEIQRLREALRGMVGLYDSDEGTRSLPEANAARAALSSTGEKG